MTKDFQLSEFACKCGCGQALISAELVNGLQELRDLLAGPIVITSGYRCPAHNARVGGAKQSQHTRGAAADIRVPGTRVRDLYRRVQEIPAFRGVGVSDEGGFIHVDIRHTPARWCYKHGRQCRWFDL